MILAATFTFLFWRSVNLCRSWSLYLEDYETIDYSESLRYIFIAEADTKVPRLVELKRVFI